MLVDMRDPSGRQSFNIDDDDKPNCLLDTSTLVINSTVVLYGTDIIRGCTRLYDTVDILCRPIPVKHSKSNMYVPAINVKRTLEKKNKNMGKLKKCFKT